MILIINKYCGSAIKNECSRGRRDEANIQKNKRGRKNYLASFKCHYRPWYQNISAPFLLSRKKVKRGMIIHWR